MKYEKGMKWNSLELISDIEGGADFKSTKKSIFICDCGLNHFATLNNVTRGIVKFCLACSSKRKSKTKKTHGNSISFKDKDPIGYNCYTRWQSMKRRCYNPKDTAYSSYGGRGIKVCNQWVESYDLFKSDMGLPPTSDHQIDRIDNNGNYEKANCRWVTRTENARNKRTNRLIEAFGKTQTLQEWANDTGVKRETIAKRLNSGDSPEKALSNRKKRVGKARRVSAPAGEFETVSDLAKYCGMSISGVHSRIKSTTYPDWCYSD